MTSLLVTLCLHMEISNTTSEALQKMTGIDIFFLFYGSVFSSVFKLGGVRYFFVSTFLDLCIDLKGDIS